MSETDQINRPAIFGKRAVPLLLRVFGATMWGWLLLGFNGERRPNGTWAGELVWIRKSRRIRIDGGTVAQGQKRLLMDYGLTIEQTREMTIAELALWAQTGLCTYTVYRSIGWLDRLRLLWAMACRRRKL